MATTVRPRVKFPIFGLVFLVALPLFPARAQSPENHFKDLQKQIVQLYQQRRYAEALPVAQEFLRVSESLYGNNGPDEAFALNLLGAVYGGMEKYADAEPLYRQALVILERGLGPESPAVLQTVLFLADACEGEKKFADAMPLYRRALEMREKALGPDHPDVAQSLNKLAEAEEGLGKYGEAEPLLERVLAIREKAQGPEARETALAANNLGFLYMAEGRYATAEPLFRRSAAIFEKSLGSENPLVATALDNLAGVYDGEGRYADAEPLYKRGLEIREEALGADDLLVGNSLNNLGNLYMTLGRFDTAEPLFRRSLEIREKKLGAGDPAVALALNNTAELYSFEGRNAEAEPLLRRAVAIEERIPENADLGATLNNLGGVLLAQKKLSEAESLYSRSLEIRERLFGPEHLDVANSLNSLGNVYQTEGRSAEALPLYERSLTIIEKTLGPEHPQLVAVLNNLATLHFGAGEMVAAAALFDRSIQNLQRQFAYHFTYMSEKDRLQFLELVGNLFPAYFSFCFANREKDFALVGRMYDVILWQKGFVASSVEALRTKIVASGDPELLMLLEQLTQKRIEAARLLRTPGADREAWRQGIERIESEANDLEKELARRSSAISEKARLVQVGWRDVQKTLKKGDAAVEFLRFRFHDGKKWTGASYYVALILTPETTARPQLIPLGEAAKLEGAPILQYRESVSLEEALLGVAAPSPGFYEAFWKPLETALGSAKRVYVSPDGVLNQVSLAVVSGPGGRELIDRYDLHIVSNTKDVLRAGKPSRAGVPLAVLIGDPRYDLDEAGQRAAATRAARPDVVKSLIPTPATADLVKSRAGSRRRRGVREFTGEVLPPLPGTKVEIESLRALLARKHWRLEVESEENALKQTVLAVRAPRVLHLATHGFFLPPSESMGENATAARNLPANVRPTQDPMLRSGLFFAGANRTLSGAPPAPDLDDGVLTAYEATGLNLQGTELVVLSACETGLGQTSASEGVFGLRRAFQEAGAEAVLMSMWSVPDKETQELMGLFYTRWLNGEEKHAALRAAQFELRERVRKRYGSDLPYYWGAFVLVGR
jgi:CHAT domain-containing protein/tetratricopeptide (TPR) repeat protein